MDSPIQLKPVKPRARFKANHWTGRPWLVWINNDFGAGMTLKEAYRNWEWNYRNAHRNQSS